MTIHKADLDVRFGPRPLGIVALVEPGHWRVQGKKTRQS